MSWFYLKDQGSRRKRIGICLRYRSLPEDLSKKVNKIKRINEHPWMIKIVELKENNQVLLEMWCRIAFQCNNKYDRNIVYHFLEEENPEWICEGDLGRGLK